MLKKSIIPSFILLASLSTMPVWSAEDEHMHEDDHEHEGHSVHEGDINPYRTGAEINLDNQLFESDFGDLSGGAFATNAPGIDADISKGAFESGNWLQFKPVAPLQFWDGDEWTSSVPNGETVNIVDALGNTVTINASETTSSSAVIGEIDTNGGVHAHVNFSLQDASNSENGSVGAYRIALKLYESAANSEVSVSYAASPVVIVFNQGLAEEQFESAVAALGDSHEEAAEAEYDADSGNLVIPVVKAGDKHYKVTLQNQGAFEFKLLQAEEVSVSHDHEHEDEHEHEE